MNSSSRDCWNCAKRATECPGMTGSSDIEPGCWVPAWEGPAALLEGVRLLEMPSTAVEMQERARREFERREAARRAYQEPLERLTKEIDRQLERLLTERYPGAPIEAFVSSFIPGGLRITAPDGAAFDFVYTTHGPSTAGGTTTMTMDLTITETKTEGEQK